VHHLQEFYPREPHRKHRFLVACAIIITLMSCLLCCNLVTTSSSVIMSQYINMKKLSIIYAFWNNLWNYSSVHQKIFSDIISHVENVQGRCSFLYQWCSLLLVGCWYWRPPSVLAPHKFVTGFKHNDITRNSLKAWSVLGGRIFSDIRCYIMIEAACKCWNLSSNPSSFLHTTICIFSSESEQVTSGRSETCGSSFF
jgi:hypothetical protein